MSSIYSLSPTTPSPSINEEIKYFNPYIPLAVYHKRSISADQSNPYSQSLWYYSRGDNGEEIRQIQDRTDTAKRLPTDEDTKKQEFPNREIKDLAKDYTKRLPALPSRFPHPLQLHRGGSLKSQRSLRTMLPIFRLSEIERSCLNGLNLLRSIEESFDMYVEQNAIVISYQHKRLLFGNITTLISVNQLFINRLESEDGMQIASVDDYFNRVLRVYPSYISNRKAREKLVEFLEKKDCNLWKWFDSIQNLMLVNGFSSLTQAMNSPIDRLIELLDSLENILSGDRYIRTLNLISRVRLSTLYVNQTMPLQISTSFEVPTRWKRQNRLKWKEISREPAEDQVIYYLRDEMRRYGNVFHMMEKAISGKNLEILEKILQTDLKIARIFNDYSEIPDPETTSKQELTPRTELFQERSINSTYQLYLEKTKNQGVQVSELLNKFEITMKSKNELLRKYVAEILENTRTKRWEIESRMDMIWQISEFLRLFKSYLGLMFGRSTVFIERYVHLGIAGVNRRRMSGAEIIGRYKRLRLTNGEVNNLRGKTGRGHFST